MGRYEPREFSPEEELEMHRIDTGTTDEQLEAIAALEPDCRCWRCKNPISHRSFVNPTWERCQRCAAEESNEQDMQALRRTVARKRSQGRRW